MDPEDRFIAGKSVLFSGLPKDLAETLFSRSTIRTYGRGETIFSEGEQAQHLFVVIRGWVKLFRTTSTGADAIVGVFSDGQGFAEAPAFRNARYPVDAVAVTETRLLRVTMIDVLALMRERPEVCLAMLGATYAHLHALVDQIEQLVAQTGQQRVARFLLALCPVPDSKSQISSGPHTVTLPYDKVLIARRLGMTPESLSRAFAKLSRNGVAIRQNEVMISDSGRLHALLEERRGTVK